MVRRALASMMAIGAFCLLAFAGPLVSAQTRPAVPTTQPLDFGTAGLDIAPAVEAVTVAPRTITLIGDALARETGSRRLRLARDLGECRSPLALPYLLKLLADPEPAMRAQAVESAGKLGDRSALPALRPLLNDPNAAVRREAVLACAALGDENVVSNALADSDVAVVAAALRVSTTSEHGDTIARRVGDLPRELRPQAIRRLGEIGTAAHAKTIARFLSSDTAARIAAVDALARLRSAEHDGAVVTLLGDKHPGVRRAATAALSSLTTGEVRRTQAIAMLRDADPGVRQAAAELFVTQPSAEAVPLLVEQFDNGDEPLRLAARDALVAAKEAAVAPAVELLADPDPRRREDGSYVLGHLRSDAALATHIAMLDDADWLVVAQAAWSLGQIGRAEAAEPLAALVKRIPPTAGLLPREQQRAFSEAVIAVARLSHRPAAADLARLIIELAPNAQRGPAPRLRAACAWGFGILGTANDTATCDALLGTVDEFLEQREAKVEAVKALGHLRYAPAATQLKRISETSLDPELRWMACWSYERVTGSPTPYVPPRQTVSPNLSIVTFP
jgi:HEAT repeat protein